LLAGAICVALLAWVVDTVGPLKRFRRDTCHQFEIMSETYSRHLILARTFKLDLHFAKLTLHDVNSPLPDHRQPDQNQSPASTPPDESERQEASAHNSLRTSSAVLIPAFDRGGDLTHRTFHARFTEACAAWLTRSASHETRAAYIRELKQFLDFVGIASDHLEQLTTVRPNQVAAWRDHLRERGLSNVAIVRKITVLRSLFSYLQTYGYTGANPAHGDFVTVPVVPRDGKTVGLSPEDCRRLIDAPSVATPEGLRDRALFAVLAYTGCRVGELTRLRVKDYKDTGGHRILEVRGKGGKERRVPLHPEAVERLETWLDGGAVRSDGDGALFRPTKTARAKGRDGFQARALTRRAVQHLVNRYVRRLGLDPAVTVHSLRVTALTTARERGSDIIDLQDFAGHADPRTTLTYIRSRDRLSKSPAYVLKY
jgi:integrase/recombinase XerD